MIQKNILTKKLFAFTVERPRETQIALALSRCKIAEQFSNLEPAVRV
jgi:hypothetical protein